MPADPVRLIHRFLDCALRSGSSAAAAPPDAQTVKLALISDGVNSLPLYVAQAKELFEKEGIRVEVTLTGSSAKQMSQLTEGGFDIGMQQSDHVVRAVEGGSDLFIFMSHSPAPDLSLVVAPGIAALEDLKGRVIAVDGARSGYALLLRKLFAEKGFKGADCIFREFGGSKERYHALKHGDAVASLLNPPFDQELCAAGFKRLGTTREYFPTYPGATCAARRSWAAHHKEQLIAFIRGFRAGYAWSQDPANKGEAVCILRTRLGLGAEAAANAFDRFARRGLPEISAEGLSQVIDVVWEAEGYSWPKPGAQRYFDPSFLRKAGD